MSNLTNVYAYLRDKYNEVEMVYGKSPLFVRILTGIDNHQKVIFIFKEDLSRRMNDYQSPIITEVDKSDTNFNFSGTDGSPLIDDNSVGEVLNTSVASKASSSIKTRYKTEFYEPIDVSLANEIANDIANLNSIQDSRGWIFILCGSSNKPSTILISLNLSKNKFIRGIGKYLGVVRNDERLIENFVQKQRCMVPNAKPEVQIESSYDLNEHIYLKFLNTMPAEMCTLSHINSSSQVNLFQKVEIGKSHILCEQLWNQLELLNMIKNDIVNAKNNSCNGTLMDIEYNYGSMKYEDLQKKVNEILSDVVTCSESNEDENDTSLEAVIKKVASRPLLEITDQLWEILRFSSSFSDLRKILTFIFQISSRSCIVNIPMNKNRLSEIIREISSQRLAIPRLSSTEPLELLLEIGIEKVMKDYEYIFSESKICLLSDINIVEIKGPSHLDANMSVRKSLAASAVPEMNQHGNRKTLLHGPGSLEGNDDLESGIRNSHFNEKESETKISKMSQIHLAIEHILMMQNNLNLDNDYKQIAKKILENSIISFEDLQAQRFDKLQIPVNDQRVIQLVANLLPNSQKIVIKSENKFKSVENVYYFNMEQIIPSMMRKESESEMIDKKGNFHFIHFMNISSKY